MKKGSHETRKTPITIPNVTAGNQFDINNFTSVFKSTRSDRSKLAKTLSCDIILYAVWKLIRKYKALVSERVTVVYFCFLNT